MPNCWKTYLPLSPLWEVTKANKENLYARKFSEATRYPGATLPSSIIFSFKFQLCKNEFRASLVPEVRCPALNITNSIANTTDVTYRTTTNVTCISGYQMNDDQFWIVTQCQADKTWSPRLFNCTGYHSTILCAAESYLNYTDNEAVFPFDCVFQNRFHIVTANYPIYWRNTKYQNIHIKTKLLLSCISSLFYLRSQCHHQNIAEIKFTFVWSFKPTECYLLDVVPRWSAVSDFNKLSMNRSLRNISKRLRRRWHNKTNLSTRSSAVFGVSWGQKILQVSKWLRFWFRSNHTPSWKVFFFCSSSYFSFFMIQ